MESGKWIRSIREERLIKPSDVERISRNIADRKGNSDFYVSHSTLADIETGSIPSIHKLFSLAICLRVSLHDLLLPFGIEPEDLAPSRSEFDSISPLQTPSVPAPAASTPAFRFQLNFDVNSSNRETNLLRVPPRELQNLPTFFRARLDPARYRFAVIGWDDDAMSDLLPAKSLVEIDTAQNTVEVFPWQTLRDRPVYLVWHTDGHTCCWCQVDGRELTMLPHPLSRQPVRRFRMPGQASIVGRVTNAWLSFGSDQLQSRSGV
jgi:transcriptional regulator with XRE-family HTH domain